MRMQSGAGPRPVNNLTGSALRGGQSLHPASGINTGNERYELLDLMHAKKANTT